MTAFVNLKGHVVRTDHVSAVTTIFRGQVPGDSPDYFAIYMIGSGYVNGLAIYGKGKQLTADRNRLLRAMGAMI